MRDGDLWKQYWRLIIMRSPWSVKHAKIKGHATAQDVAQGIISDADRSGNHIADGEAKAAHEHHEPWIEQFRTVTIMRQKLFNFHTRRSREGVFLLLSILPYLFD